MATRGSSQRQRSSHRMKTRAQMGDRTMKVIPVGAWVESVPVRSQEQYHAVYAAQVEEERLRRMQEEKEAKLRRFQRDVKRRVKEIQKVKRQQQLESSFKAVDLQTKVIQQSSHAAERLTPKKNTCVFRSEEQHSIQQSVSKDSASYGPDDGRVFEEHSHQVHRAIRQARKKLAAKKMDINQGIPGGVWKVSPTRDPPQSGKEIPTDEKIETGSIESETNIPQQPIDELSISDEENAVVRETEVVHDPETVYQQAGMSPPKVVSFSPLVGRPLEVVRETSPERAPIRFGGQPKTVQFDPHKEPDEVLPRRQRTRRLCTRAAVLEVKPGIQDEENKKQTRSQFSMYRRLFMDIEREQVKENIKKREHRRKMLRLKREKELERKREEMLAEIAVEPRDPVTGQTEKEALKKAKDDEDFMHQTMQKQKKKKQKQKEMDRYIDALRAMMKDKIDKQKIQLPPLCNCGPSIWDANPDTCANNCVFYRNPKAYAKALQSVLTSCEVV